MAGTKVASIPVGFSGGPCRGWPGSAGAARTGSPALAEDDRRAAPRRLHRRCDRVPAPGSRCTPGHLDASLREGAVGRQNLGRDQGSGPRRGCRSQARHRRVRGSAGDGRPPRCDVAGDCAVLPARMALAMIDTHVGPNTVWARQGPAVVVRALRNGWPTVTSMCSACSHRAGDCALHPCIAG